MVDGIFSVADTFPITCNIFRINLILYSNPHISICKTILSRKLDIGDLPSVYQRHSKLDKLLELNLRLSYQPCLFPICHFHPSRPFRTLRCQKNVFLENRGYVIAHTTRQNMIFHLCGLIHNGKL